MSLLFRHGHEPFCLLRRFAVPKRFVSVPEQETHFDCLPLRDHKPPQQTKWLRVQDQRRPRRAAPTSSPSSPRGRSRSSRRLSVSWTQTKTVSCPPVTLLPLSTLLASPFPTVRPKACSQRHPDLPTELKAVSWTQTKTVSCLR